MDLITILQICLRRWKVVVPITLLTLAGAGYMTFSQPPEYQAAGSALLMGPSAAAGNDAVDPLVLTRRLHAAPIFDQLQAAGATSPYEITLSEDGTIMRVVATSDTSETAQVTADLVADELVTQVGLIQDEAEVSDLERLRVEVLGRSVEAVDVDGDSQWQAIVTIGVTDPFGGAVNPWTPSSGTIRVVQELVMSGAARQEVVAAGGTPNYAVSQSSRDSAPIFGITTSGPDAGQVVASFDLVLAVFNAELARLQQDVGVAPSEWVQARALAPPLGATDISGPISKPAIALVGLGGLVAVGAALLVEYLSRHRRERQFDSLLFAQGSDNGNDSSLAVNDQAVPEGRVGSRDPSSLS